MNAQTRFLVPSADGGLARSRWSAEDSESLKRLAFEGKTASQAATILGSTRNACIAKSHRMGFRFDSVVPQNTQRKNGTRRTLSPEQIAQLREKAETGHSLPVTAADMGITVRSAEYWARKHQIKFKRGVSGRAKQEKRPVPFAAPPSGGITIIALTAWTCRWPFGDPTESTFSYCGASVDNYGNSYCADHHKLSVRG
jgi:GcrA cell cycle regulator